MKESFRRGIAAVLAALCVLSVSVCFPLDSVWAASDVEGLVTGNGVNIRELPSTKSKVLIAVPRGTEVRVSAEIDGWYCISYGAYQGYMSADYVKLSGELDNVTLSGVIIGSAVNLRVRPSTGSSVLKVFPKDTKVTICDQDNGWYQLEIEDGDKTYKGWMSADYVQILGANDTEPEEKTAIVSGSLVNVRSAPNLSGKVLTAIENGVEVVILEQGDDWHKISYDEVVGYMSASYLDLELSEAEVNAQRQRLVEIAKKYIGIRYVWGGSTPKQGFDCSGLVTYVYNEWNGYQFRVRTQLYLNGTNVAYNQLEPGDLVFFDTVGEGNTTHVGIYVGNGSFIHAPKPGSNVTITTMAKGTYFYRTFKFARRIIH